MRAFDGRDGVDLDEAKPTHGLVSAVGRELGGGRGLLRRRRERVRRQQGAAKIAICDPKHSGVSEP